MGGLWVCGRGGGWGGGWVAGVVGGWMGCWVGGWGGVWVAGPPHYQYVDEVIFLICSSCNACYEDHILINIYTHYVLP